MPQITDELREQDRMKNLETAPHHVKVLSDWVVTELAKLEQIPEEEGGVLVKGASEDVSRESARKVIPAMQAKMYRMSPPGTNVPKQDVIRAWRRGSHKKMPTDHFAAIAAYRGLGESTEMIRLWLLGATQGAESEIQPITLEQIYACDKERLVWVIETCAHRLGKAIGEKEPPEDPKKSKRLGKA